MKLKFDNQWGCKDFHLITIGYYESMFESQPNAIYFLIFNVGFSIEF